MFPSRTHSIRSVLLVVAMVFVAVSGAMAGTATSITGLYTTGTGTGSRDSNWLLSDGRRAYVVTSSVPGDWMDNTTSARWVSYSNNAQACSSDAGTFSYTLKFRIGGTGTNPVSNVAITLALAVDDSATIAVNGSSAGMTVSGWDRISTVTLNAGNSNFVLGENTITLTVSNSGRGATGLFVSSISGVVPEVGAWAPAAAALGVFCWFRFFRGKRRFPAAV